MSTHDEANAAALAKNGGPAYPVDLGPAIWAGMSLRDRFAVAAMQAAATNPGGANGFTFTERAQWAYQQADAMLKVRSEPPIL